LKHVLRAAAGITGETSFVLVGSQAVLVQYPSLPRDMAVSAEIDIYPLQNPDLAELIDGTIGSDSVFHETFGYYADGVGPRTARLPASWQERAVTLKATAATGGATALAPDIHDLGVAKLLAGRSKDLEWIQAGLRTGLMTVQGMTNLLGETDASEEERTLALSRLHRMAHHE
jgi:hypothetical protein